MRSLDNRRGRTALLAFVLVGCAGLAAGRLARTGTTYGGDAVYYFAQVRSMTIDRDLDFANEYRLLNSRVSDYTGNFKLPGALPVHPSTGRAAMLYPIGVGILLLPFYATGHGIARIVAAFTGGSTDGFGVIESVAVALGSLVYSGLALLLIQRAGRAIGFDGAVAFVGAVGIFLGTAWLYYASLDPVYSHAFAAFAGALFFVVLLRALERGAGWWLLLGACAGLLGLVRYQDLAFGLLAPAALAWRWRESIAHPGRAASRLATFAIGLAAVVSLQLGVHFHLYGDPLETGHRFVTEQGFSHLLSPQLLFTALSAESGFLRWAPVTGLAFAGVWMLRRRRPLEAALCAAGILGHWYVISAWDDLAQGDSFGNRHQVSCSVFLALGLMEFVRRVGERWPRMASSGRRIVFLAALGSLNVGLMTLYALRVIGVPY